MLHERNKMKRYCEVWSESLARLLSQLTSQDWQSDPGVLPAEGSQPLVRLRISPRGLPGQQWVSFCEPDLAALLSLFLHEDVPLLVRLEDTHKEAILALTRQWSGMAATLLNEDFGEVSFDVAFEEAVRRELDSPSLRLLCAHQGERSVSATLEIDTALAAVMREPELGGAEIPAATLPLLPSDRITALLGEGNLELLMDVELAVMLRFGSRVATLQEVLDLATGAVLELDREIQEPVDLMLNDRVIARGEVVVVDGNYGLRVSEVASPQQRVNSL